MTDLASRANVAEAILWFVFAVTFGVITYRERNQRQRLFLMLAFAFFAFGISDLIEAKTGAWWRPFWLLALKSACIGVFAYAVWQFHRIRKKGKHPPQEDTDALKRTRRYKQ